MDAESFEVVVANVARPMKHLRCGAKVTVLWMPGDCDDVQVSGMAKGGRRINIWVRTNKLTNARIKKLPRDVCDKIHRFAGYHGRSASFVAEIINSQAAALLAKADSAASPEGKE